MLFLRFFAICAGGLVVWSAAVSQVAGEGRLPVAAVVVGATITQPFGCTTLALEPFDPFCPSHHVHTGVDLSAPTGTAVHSATAGVARVGFDGKGAGLYVSIVLDGHVRILYCHLSRTLVSPGDHVSAGDVVGEVGATGLATGPHLHLEVQVDGRSVDPVQWLASSGP